MVVFSTRTGLNFRLLSVVRLVYYMYVECTEIKGSLNFSEVYMARTATIQARIDPEVKAKAQRVLNTLNISMSEAISLYLTQVVLRQGIPFEVKIPNRLTAATLQKSEEGKELNEVGSVDELFQELER